MGSIGKRIISKGYLLYEYLNDEDRYALVGVVDSTLDGHSINPETGIDTDKEEAEEFLETGKVNIRVTQNEGLPVQPK